MHASPVRSWLPAALLAGAAYLLVGRAFAAPAAHVRAWRLAAWIVSAAIYGAHIAHEHRALRSPPRRTASHVAAAVAMGAFGLAVAGMLHALSTTGTIRPAWRLALVAWPVVTAVPAFVVALAVAAVLVRVDPARRAA